MNGLLAKAILDPKALGLALAHDVGGRYNVYRNNYLINLGNALRTTFPAIQRLVGGEFFAALAYAFAERHPPRSPIMANYGSAFPDFLERFEALADFPYLPDIARLEYARVQAYHAADVDGFDVDGQAALMAALDQPTRLHPSVTTIPSLFPIHSIWQAQIHEDGQVQLDWLAETALVWRYAALETVEVKRIDARELGVLKLLATGGNLALLLADCPDQQSAASLVSKFVELAAAGIIVPAMPRLDHGDTP